MYMENKKIKLIIGLGNPDDEYKNTYHNVGIQFIEFLQNSKLEIKNLKLLSSENYMNNSGLFVKEQLKKHKIKPENLLVTHDDSDIVLGNYKLSFGRGSAGHKGAQNVIDQLKTKNLWRLRIGIRPPKEKTRSKADSFVLKKISPTNSKKLEKVFKEITTALLF